MKFYCINKKESSRLASGYLKQACQNLGVEFVEIVSEDFDLLDMPKISAEDMLYRVSTDKTSSAIEQIFKGHHIKNFYKNGKAKSEPSYLSLANTEVSIPKTIAVPVINKKNLKKYIEYLGGFPIIIKVTGSNKGVGVIKADSLSSLYSIVDYLNSCGVKYILREFIDSKSSIRMAVLGDEVIASIEYKSRSEDFRSNSSLSNVKAEAKIYSKEIQEAAVVATKMRGLDFGGVDIMLDQKGKYYVLEVNFPFGFPEIQEKTGVNIAEKMVSFLMTKNK